MRGGGTQGRFDYRHEVDHMYEGMTDDLYQPVGMTLDWWVYNAEATTVDPIYDVAGPTVGRAWLDPVPVPVLGARLTQQRSEQSQQGFYTSDMLSVVINVGQVDLIVRDLVDNPDPHLSDRFEYKGAIWSPKQIWPRGALRGEYSVVSVQAYQVKPDEMVNDEQFAEYAAGPFR